ncbi:P22 phage major capsid protein family protein [Bosea sp. 2RAB26]|uniref:P22 phage major capsid protein family protein n=1 Tax=Bosea sp. 2RAB26 TaxID=3237476 RepID=UPI003F8E3624
MANDLKVQDIIVREAQYQLKNALVLGNLVSRVHEGEFASDVDGWKKGDKVRVKRPENFIPGEGATLSVAEAEEATMDVVVDTQLNKGLSFTSKELTLFLSGPKGARRIGEEKIKPLMHAFANRIDSDLAGLYRHVPNHVGTPGLTIDSYPDYLKGTERLNELAVPMDARYGLLSPADDAGLKGAFNNYYDTAVSRNALQKARLPMLDGSDVYMSQNVKTHLVGVATGTPLVQGAGQAVSYAASKASYTQTLNTDGWTNSTTGILKAGDIITIAGVFAVNPVDGDVLPFLRQFVVRADADSGASTGPAALTISPPIITSGPYKTVSAAPADNAPITVVGTGGTGYRQPMIFHKDAFHLAVVPMEMPEGAAFKARINEDGISVRVVSGYGITDDISTWRFDVLYGVTPVSPNLAVRLNGTA